MPRNVPFFPIGPLQSLCGQIPKKGRWDHIGETDYDSLVEFNADGTWNLKAAQVAMDLDLWEPRHWNKAKAPNAFCLGVKLLAFSLRDFISSEWTGACRGGFVKKHRSEALPQSLAVLTAVEWEASEEGFITRFNWGRIIWEASGISKVFERMATADAPSHESLVRELDEASQEIPGVLVGRRGGIPFAIDSTIRCHLPERVSKSDWTTSRRSHNRIKETHLGRDLPIPEDCNE